MNCPSVRQTLSALALFCSLAPAYAQVPGEQDRLIATGKLWVTVKYFHPYIASRPIDWDKALVDALPAIRSATTEGQFTSAINQMLSTLHDPVTRIVSAAIPRISGGLGPIVQRTWIHHGLPSATPSALDFYDAFLVKPAYGDKTAAVPLTPALRVDVRLSEPLSSASETPHPQPDSAYADTPYPSPELRILSAYRIWGAVHYFYAYRDLMDEDWDAIFADTLPKFIAAKDAREYHLRVAEMISRLSDSTCTTHSAELDRYFGEASPNIPVRLIEKRLTVLRDSGDLHRGDIITTIDGEKMSDRIKREANYISASTAQALSAAVTPRLLDGPPNSTAALTVSGANDGTRIVTLPRQTPIAAPVPEDEPVRLLSGNIGYADLTRLTDAEVNSIYDKLRNTTAIIFDARGPVSIKPSLLAARLNSNGKPTAYAIVTGPIALEPDGDNQSASYFSMEGIEPTSAPKFKGKTVMLIDERTIGNAERVGMALQVANGTELLGTPSAGAVTDQTQFVAPGGLTITFSGHDIRHANAGPIQRMGLQPSIALAPKVAAVRAGRDIVLEKALEYLKPPTSQAHNTDLSNALSLPYLR